MKRGTTRYELDTLYSLEQASKFWKNLGAQLLKLSKGWRFLPITSDSGECLCLKFRGSESVQRLAVSTDNQRQWKSLRGEGKAG